MTDKGLNGGLAAFRLRTLLESLIIALDMLRASDSAFSLPRKDTWYFVTEQFASPPPPACTQASRQPSKLPITQSLGLTLRRRWLQDW